MQTPTKGALTLKARSRYDFALHSLHRIMPKIKSARSYPSEHERFGDLSGFLNIVRGLRPRWRKLHLPTQSDRLRPYGEEKALWFRGQKNSSWGLSPKIWRSEYEDANEAEMRLEFESVGTPLTQSGMAYGKWHWYFLMQHYRVPTRLLDWSTSPLVALYFAVSEESTSDRAVWIVDPWRWNRAHVKGLYGPAIADWRETRKYLLDLEDAFDTEVSENQTQKRWPIAIEPSHVDRRVAAQGSKFVLFGTEKDMTESPAINNRRGGKTKHAIVDKIVIPNLVADQLREELNQIGINERSMFPDLEGLGRHICWEWKCREALGGNKRSSQRKRSLRSSRVIATPDRVSA